VGAADVGVGAPNGGVPSLMIQGYPTLERMNTIAIISLHSLPALVSMTAWGGYQYQYHGDGDGQLYNGDGGWRWAVGRRGAISVRFGRIRIE
jgi:hypothetical protein